jgi:transketolase
VAAGVHAVDPYYKLLGEPAVSLDDIRQFRAGEGHSPGHPEYRFTSGVETTTGPLGQSAPTSVGMAAAAAWLGWHRPDGLKGECRRR